MGQYYRGMVLDRKTKTSIRKFATSYDHGSNGAKLMEHSYLGNDYVSAFETLIIDNPQRVVWAGDYADDCKNRKSCLYSRKKDNQEVKITERADEWVGEGEESCLVIKYPYIINHTKKEFIDKTTIQKCEGWSARIHPLPLMTCEGNGRGGGDFHVSTQYDRKGKQGNVKLIGSWSRDVISISKNKPTGYKQLKFDLKE